MLGSLFWMIDTFLSYCPHFFVVSEVGLFSSWILIVCFGKYFNLYLLSIFIFLFYFFSIIYYLFFKIGFHLNRVALFKSSKEIHYYVISLSIPSIICAPIPLSFYHFSLHFLLSLSPFPLFLFSSFLVYFFLQW